MSKALHLATLIHVHHRENSKQERQITLPVPTRSSTFGVPLEELMGFSGEKGSVPRVVKDCIQYLRETGKLFSTNVINCSADTGPPQVSIRMDSLGDRPIRYYCAKYRMHMTEVGLISLSSDALEWYLMPNKGNVVSMDTIGDPHLAAVLLKKFLRDLPQPIFPDGTYAIIRRCPPPNENLNDIAAVTYMRDTLLPQLDPCVYIVLSHYLRKFIRWSP